MFNSYMVKNRKIYNHEIIFRYTRGLSTNTASSPRTWPRRMAACPSLSTAVTPLPARRVSGSHPLSGSYYMKSKKSIIMDFLAGLEKAPGVSFRKYPTGFFGIYGGFKIFVVVFIGGFM